MNTKSISVLLSLACAGVACAASNYDLLGRNGSKMNSPMVYKNVDYAKAQKSSLDENKALKKANGGVRNVMGYYDSKSGTYGYEIFFNDHSPKKRKGITRLDYADYFDVMNAYTNKKVVFDTLSKVEGYKYYISTKTSYNVVFGGYVSPANQPSPYESSVNINYFKMPTNVSLDNYSSAVGVYVASDAEPAKLTSLNDGSYKVISSRNRGTTEPNLEMEASLMHQTLKNLSKYTVPYSYDMSVNESKGYPVGVETLSPQVYVGLHTRKSYYGNSSVSRTYSSMAQKLDNYIFDNQTVEIVGAGNFATHVNGYAVNGYLAEEAHSANAIVVGSLALDLTTGLASLENSSSRQSPKYGAQKPDMLNLTNYFFGTPVNKYYKESSSYEPYPTFINGTQGAAALTAAQVANLLAERPFYRWHPEAVKAYMLTSSFVSPTTGRINGVVGYPSMTFIPGKLSDGVAHYSSFFNGDLTSSNIEYDSHTKSYVHALDFYLTEGNVYRASIAWLCRGDDLVNTQHLPLDFDLYVYDVFDNSIAASTSSNNPYEVVEFTPKKSGTYTFKIHMYNDETSVYDDYRVGFDLMEISTGSGKAIPWIE